ncbi:MAG: hypothetical protein PHC64_03515 [Candidatus Gastranaerophilales bacterium]|nr:hypothetical protein [Candidatus Gastranaerophilales bacterium]
MGSIYLDNLASSGVVNFDPEAYIKGTEPRYYGKPPEDEFSNPFDQPLLDCPQIGDMTGVNLHGEPDKDAFIQREHGKEHEKEVEHKNPRTWKELATIGLVGGVSLYAMSKMGTIATWISDTYKKIKTAATAAAPAAAPGAPGLPLSLPTGGKGIIEKIVEFSKDKYKVVADYLKGSPAWAKKAGWAAAGLFALYCIYKALTGGHKRNSAPNPTQSH